MKRELKKIGIDRTQLRNFVLTDFDLDRIKELSETNKVTYIEASSNEKLKSTVNGKKVYQIIIYDDDMFNRLVVGHAISQYGNVRMYCTLDITQDRSNLYNESIDQYTERVEDIFRYIERYYSLKFDISSIKFKELELNITIPLKHKYSEYGDILRRLMMSVPLDWKKNLCEYTKISKKDGSYPGTIYSGINGLKLKFYDKKAHLTKKSRDLQGLSGDALRIEFTIFDYSIEFNNFGVIWEIKQDDLEEWFIDKWKAAVIKGFMRWNKARLNRLTAIVKKYLSKPSGWMDKLAFELAVEHNKECLVFGISEIFDIFDKLNIWTTTQKSRQKSLFADKLKLWDDLFNDKNEMLDEIISTLRVE